MFFPSSNYQIEIDEIKENLEGCKYVVNNEYQFKHMINYFHLLYFDCLNISFGNPNFYNFLIEKFTLEFDLENDNIVKFESALFENREVPYCHSENREKFLCIF